MVLVCTCICGNATFFSLPTVESEEIHEYEIADTKAEQYSANFISAYPVDWRCFMVFRLVA